MHIAIVVPAFNIAGFLRECVLSVLAQTHTDWSLVVVDDGSTDETAAVADGFADERIFLLRQDNAGVSAARNAGIVMVLSRSKTSYHRARSSFQSGEAATVDGLSSTPFFAAVKASAARCPDDMALLSTGIAAQQPVVDAFLFLDGDDWLAPHALAMLAKALDSAPSAVAACGRYARGAQHAVAYISAPPPGGRLLERLLTRNLFANGGHLLIRR